MYISLKQTYCYDHKGDTFSATQHTTLDTVGRYQENQDATILLYNITSFKLGIVIALKSSVISNLIS